MILNRWKLTPKLILAMALVGLVPLAVGSVLTSMFAGSALDEAAINQVESLQIVKKSQIEAYFAQIQNQVVTMSEDPMIVSAVGEFKQAMRSLPNDLAVSEFELDEYRRANAEYYSGQFAVEFESQNGRTTPTENLTPTQSSAIVAQYLYMANNPNPLGSKETLDSAYDGSHYSSVHAKYHPAIRSYLQKFGYYDIFLVDPQSGQIVYSVFKEIDYATSLKSGPYKDTNFARAFREALTLTESDDAKLVDFAPYLPSYDGPASFIASPIFDGSELAGVLLFQMPIATINGIMQQSAGLGESGETYLVGHDKLMRSQSRFSEENTILATKVDTDAMAAISSGNAGNGTMTDYTGTTVFSSYAPVNIAGLNWGLIAEIDKKEARAAVRSLYLTSVIIALISVVAVVGVATMFARSLTRPLTVAVSVAESIAGGQLDNKIAADTQCEVGDLLRALSRMQGNLSSGKQADRQELAANTRIKQALDNVDGNITVCDANGEIVYLNDAATRLFQGADSEIRQTIPTFSASQMIGSRIDQITGESLQETTSTSNASDSAEITLGGITLKCVRNPISGPGGERFGSVVEWTDRTQEMAIEDEVQAVVRGALRGDLSRRISTGGKTEFFESLSEGVNQLVSVAEQVVTDTVRVLSAMASGDLTKTIDSEYEGSFDQLKRDANATVSKLTEVVSQIQMASGSVKSGASEISQGNSDLNQRTVEQASNLERTSSSMEEITATVKQNADNAGQANQLSKAAREQAVLGGEVVGQAVEAMEKINESSRKISDIIGVIDEIAFQTNLLALNASVEAARAGEQGRGFAVVASEVRNLAGRSATAAKEIKALIVDSGTKVAEGSRLVNESGSTLKEIVTRIMKVTDIVGEITVASQEQATALEEVNHAISDMDGLTQQNAAVVEEATAASESLGEQAESLDQLTSFFTIDSSRKRTVHASVSTPVSTPMMVERRSADRPWSEATVEAPSVETSEVAEISASVDVPEPAPKATPRPLEPVETEAPPRAIAVNDDDQVWTEF